MELTEQEEFRHKAAEEIRKLGIDPYPAALYEVNANAAEILANYEREKGDYQNISIAGRIMGRRIMGNASFAELQDQTGRIQIYIKRDEICPGEDKTLYNTVFKKLLDIGDIIGVKGFVFTTNTGTISIHVTSMTLLCKSLRPLPVTKVDSEGKAHDVVTDPELRYRQRYVDLIVNPNVKNVFMQRAKIMNSMRNFFNERGYLEVETPILQSIPGGAAARPFITHHNALDMPLYLRIANELYLKRLIVGGFDAVYEFAKDFRNEGMDRTHNPEFTQMEIYVAYKDYEWMMQMTEEMLEKIAMDLYGTTVVPCGDYTLDFKRPFKRIGILDAIKEHTGDDVSAMDETELRKICQKHNVHVEASMGVGKMIDELFSEKCEKHYRQPTFVIDYPVEMSPLTKKHRTKPGLVERFELMVNGKELANAYSELNDPVEQRLRFEEQMRLAEKGDDEAMTIDNDFLRALEYGMPPCSGIGMGIDRLTMLMTNNPSIQDVLFFPQMRPEIFKANTKDLSKEKLASDYLEAGIKKFKDKNYDDSIIDFNKVIELNPKDSNVYFYRGMAKNSLKNFNEAIQDFTISINLEPENINSYFNRALIKNRLNLTEEAIYDLNKVIQLKPDHANAYYNRGIFNAVFKKYDEAFEDYNKAIALNPELAHAYLHRGHEFEILEKYQEALSDYEKAKEIYIKQGNKSGIEESNKSIEEVKKEMSDNSN